MLSRSVDERRRLVDAEFMLLAEVVASEPDGHFLDLAEKYHRVSRAPRDVKDAVCAACKTTFERHKEEYK